MVGIVARIIYFLCALLLIECQTNHSSEDQLVKGNSDLKTSDGVLDLSQFSHEQQKTIKTITKPTKCCAKSFLCRNA